MDAIILDGLVRRRIYAAGTSDGGSIHDGLRARSATMEQGIREELRTHSRYIRDHLIPLVGGDGRGCELNSRDMALLRSTLMKVNAISVTPDVLRFSRIEKALVLISAPGWPADIAAIARRILVRWEYALGPLQELRADLWGIGGRLEGVRKVEFKMPDDAEWVSSWKQAILISLKVFQGNEIHLVRGGNYGSHESSCNWTPWLSYRSVSEPDKVVS